MENRIVEYLFNLVYGNIYATKKEILITALRNRFVGFRAEIEFYNFCVNRNYTLYEGGFIIPLRDKKKTLSSPLYFTVDNKSPEYYKEIYYSLNQGSFSKLIYIRYDINVNINQWKTVRFEEGSVEFPIPNFKIYDFQGDKFIYLGDDIQILITYFTPKLNSFKQKLSIDENNSKQIKDYLNRYNNNQLINLYVSRLIFDGFIGFKYYKGITSDIDLIMKDNNSDYRFYEIKEKDLSKTKPIGFGIDVQRLHDCLEISSKLNIDYLYIVRQVDNQKDRNFMAWRFIDFKEFDKLTDKNIIKKGGAGMNTCGNSENPTLLVEEKQFSIFTHL